VVLLVEDHANLAREIGAYLRAEGWRVHITGDGLEGLRLALEQTWSMILLDLSLPGVDGTVICQRLREEGVNTPILMITARGLRRDVVGGLDCGADDYLVKPFGLDELVARMRALTRRTGTTRRGWRRRGEPRTSRVRPSGTPGAPSRGSAEQARPH
jgi:DNA-binding response OmpR family regulator